jgi:hypothetical protein
LRLKAGTKTEKEFNKSFKVIEGSMKKWTVIHGTE